MLRWTPVLVAAAVFAGAGSLWAAPDRGPAQISLSAKMGEVVFTHAKHQNQLRIDCLACHHTGIDPMEKCSDCHGTKGDVPVIKDVYHQLCRGCHLQGESGPIKCMECHKR